MNEASLVSVLMCVYNTPPGYLEQAIESILQQTVHNIELIIVDDASDCEEVQRLLRGYAESDNRVRLVHNPENIGLTRSLNVGLPMCYGKYIARMDADDISCPERIEKQVSFLDSHENSVLVGSRITVLDDDGMETGEQPSHSGEVDPETYRIRSLLQHAGPPHPTFMFRASFLRENDIQYREDILKAQDYGIMADILKANGRIDIMREPLLKYRVHAGQITSSSQLEQKAYQSRVSYDYIRYVFPELAEPACAALSLLGCGLSLDDAMGAIMDNGKLGQACDHLAKNRALLQKPGTFVTALKRIIKTNVHRHVYDPAQFEAELRSRWWKLALRTSKQRKRPWGMSPYTILSYRF